MLSFPSTLDKGGANMRILGVSSGTASRIRSLVREDPSWAYEDLSRMKAINLNLNSTVKQQLLQDDVIDAGRYSNFIPEKEYNQRTDKKIRDRGYNKAWIENIFAPPSDVLSSMNKYRFIYKKGVRSVMDAGYVGEGDNMEINIAVSRTAAVPSMFNPMFAIQAIGPAPNVPLLNGTINQSQYDPNLSNCSIRELVTLSQRNASILGQARYRYADFMYCKDLGKVSNNHLITLRRFAHPVGDNIFGPTSAVGGTNGNVWNDKNRQVGDVGRLVTWFGTDDNKLEDICTFSVGQSWKKLTAEIQEEQSQEDQSNNSPIGAIVNSLNPGYNKMAAAGFGGANSIVSGLTQRFYGSVVNNLPLPASMKGSHFSRTTDTLQNNAVLGNYDKNKVYEPKNRLDETHIYDGKLTFNQEITIKFCYKLRAYDNINPKSAYLDLLANILQVTYTKGKFWGGSRKLIGPPQNTAGWKKANALIDNAFEKFGGFMSNLANGNVDWSGMMKNLASMIEGGAEKVGKAIADMAQNGLKSQTWQSMLSSLKSFDAKTGISAAMRGHLKNALGRPAIYAWNSLLSGDNVGLWHLTVGNPKNPILAIGNLIINEGAVTIQQGGPLGLDDFPTDLTVTVKLQHARPRDLVDIARMYTKGNNAIYNYLASHKLSDFKKLDGYHFDEDEFNKARATVAKGQGDIDKASYDEAKKAQQQAEEREAQAKQKNEATQEGGTPPATTATADANNKNKNQTPAQGGGSKGSSKGQGSGKNYTPPPRETQTINANQYAGSSYRIGNDKTGRRSLLKAGGNSGGALRAEGEGRVAKAVQNARSQESRPNPSGNTDTSKSEAQPPTGKSTSDNDAQPKPKPKTSAEIGATQRMVTAYASAESATEKFIGEETSYLTSMEDYNKLYGSTWYFNSTTGTEDIPNPWIDDLESFKHEVIGQTLISDARVVLDEVS